MPNIDSIIKLIFLKMKKANQRMDSIEGGEEKPRLRKNLYQHN